MTIKINGTNTVANPSITGTDTDTGIVYGSDQIDFSTGGSSKVTLKGSNLGIGITSPVSKLHLSGNITLDNSSNAPRIDFVEHGDLTDTKARISMDQISGTEGQLKFYTEGSGTLAERMSINNSGNVTIGQTTAGFQSKLTVGAGTSDEAITILTGASSGGALYFADGTSNNDSRYRGWVQYNHTDDYITFGTAASEKFRISWDGKVMINTTNSAFDGVTGNLNIANTNTNNHTVINCSRNTTSARSQIRFSNPNGNVGSIQTGGSGTSYNTSSDYRLKENEVAISDGISRLKQLKPYKFNFKTDSSTILDGFFAHEVSSIVPEAITGTKDAVVTQSMIDTGEFVEGTLNDPIHQGIDQSKLVPLLTAALQEAVAKIEVLETKVAALEAG